LSWQLWFLFAVTETVLCFVPGPAVLLVLSQAISRGTKLALWSILGILAANTLYFVLSATGIGAVLLASYELFFAIKWVGAVYLVWLGVTAFFGKSKLLSLSGAAERGTREPRMFANGFILQMSNPKALVFFTALVPQFIDTHAPVWPQIMILALTSVAIEFLVQFFYATLAGRATVLVTRPRFAVITDRAAGALLVAAGAGLAAIRRA
jgi:homoserine/homoserine lactone efflux protein